MKRIFCLLAVVLTMAVACLGKGVTWTRPQGIIYQNMGCQMTVTDVELTPECTTMHLSIRYLSGYWIRFMPETFLRQVGGDAHYKIRSARGTRPGEVWVELGQQYVFPDSGKANFALQFEPIPLDTKAFDFIEGEGATDWRILNISNPKAKACKADVPKDWRKVRYAKDEMLPDALISKGTATIHARVMGYRPDVPMSLTISGFTPIDRNKRFWEKYPIAPDGTVTARIPLDMTRQVKLGLEPNGNAHSDGNFQFHTLVLIGPGQETEMLIDLRAEGNPYREFRGYLARTNKECTDYYYQLRRDQRTNALSFHARLSKCETPEQRLQLLADRLTEEKRSVNKSRHTSASRALHRMEAEYEYIDWVKMFEQKYIDLLNDAGLASYPSLDKYLTTAQEYSRLMPLEVKERIQFSSADYEATSQRYAPCSLCFWDFSIFGGEGSDPYTNDLRCTQLVVMDKAGANRDRFVQQIKSEDCLAILRDFEAKRQQHGEENK